jgi:hypothetical protein
MVDEDVWSSIIENIYKIKGHREYYVNPMVDGEFIWQSLKLYDTILVDAIEI